MNTREEFEKKFSKPVDVVWAFTSYVPANIYSDAFNATVYQAQFESWQAATSSVAAKYEARIKELEEALHPIASMSLTDKQKEGKQYYYVGVQLRVSEIIAMWQALSTTSPDKALQRDRLLTRFDENVNFSGASIDAIRQRQKELRAELAALNLEGE